MERTLVTYLLIAKSVFNSVISHPAVVLRLKEEGRVGGGFFCLADSNGQPFLICKLGEPNAEKFGKYLEFCQEKAKRLAAHPEQLLSRSSRNPVANQWAGAIRGSTHIFSFSGLPEDLDEIFAILTAVANDELSTDDAVQMAALEEGNTFQWLIPELYTHRRQGKGARG